MMSVSLSVRTYLCNRRHRRACGVCESAARQGMAGRSEGTRTTTTCEDGADDNGQGTIALSLPFSGYSHRAIVPPCYLVHHVMLVPCWYEHSPTGRVVPPNVPNPQARPDPGFLGHAVSSHTVLVGPQASTEKPGPILSTSGDVGGGWNRVDNGGSWSSNDTRRAGNSRIIFFLKFLNNTFRSSR